MKKREIPALCPYTSIRLRSLREANNLLQHILSAKVKISPRKIDKPVILYGAGSLGKMAKHFFDYLGIPFLFVVDKDASRRGTDMQWQNIRIIHPDDVKNSDKKNGLLVICVITTPLIELRDELRNDGWEDTAFFYDVSEAYRGQYPMDNGWFLGNPSQEGKESIEKVFSSLADDSSRAYYTQFLAWRRLRTELLFSGLEVNNDTRFFVPEVTDALYENEVFVDCGAHKGSVTEKFLRTVGDKYGAIYSIEPDSSNFKILDARLRNIPNMTVLEYALSNKNGKEKFFQDFDFASKLSKNGGNSVRSVTLDSLKIPATLIKMHLEGGELNALRGTINTIRKYRPIVAVTLYHNSDGAWRIPLFLMRKTKNYKYYLRLHSWGGTGAVLYAIPDERVKIK